MKFLLGGVRGSTPVSEPEFLGYGGCTTSVLVEGDDGSHVLIDAGSGLRILANHLHAQGSLRSLPILMTHYHLDHIIGFPTFSALYDPECSLNIAAPKLQGADVQQALSRVMENPLWPVQLKASAARLSFTSLGLGTYRNDLVLGGLTVRWCAVNHPGGCTAYRFDESATGKSLVFATDIEWRVSSPEEQENFRRFCMEPGPPDLLVFDGQFTDEEYPSRVGWGHSSWQDAACVAEDVKAGQLLVTHHCPSKNDKVLAEVEKQLQRVLPTASLAHQAQYLEVGVPVGAPVRS